MKSLLLPAVTLAVLSPAAFAQGFSDNARVLESRPVIERIPIKREECWNEQVRTYENKTVTRTDTGAAIGPGTVLGAIIGGVAGHQVGSGRGNTAATIAGTIAGGAIGNQVDRNNQGQATEVERVPTTRNVEKCRQVEEVREVTVGYDVRYVYNGHELHTRLPHDPGPRLKVAVDVRPVAPEQAPPPPHAPGPRPPRY
jgi:uncharacterized protein YcfJ